jgi:hypothetical protein
MADDDPGVARGLAALHAWLSDFPQLVALRPAADADAASRLAEFDRAEVATAVLAVAAEIYGDGDGAPPPASAARAWTAVRAAVRARGLAGDAADDDCDTRGGRYRSLCALLCHALSDRCARQAEYVGRVVAGGRPDVQQELMRIIQENAPCGEDDDANVSGEYSAFVDALLLRARLFEVARTRRTRSPSQKRRKPPSVRRSEEL